MSEEEPAVEFIAAPNGIHMDEDGVWTLKLQAPPGEGVSLAALAMYTKQSFRFKGWPMGEKSASKKL